LAHDGYEGFVAILKVMPDLELCDISMPIMSGFEVLERPNALAPHLGQIPLVFLTALTDGDSELRARRLGTDDYVAKLIDFEILHTIINARIAGIARNEVWPTHIDLNDREIEMLTWVARGKTSAEIANMLGLPKRTIDFHLDNARAKLGARTLDLPATDTCPTRCRAASVRNQRTKRYLRHGGPPCGAFAS
jgi:DNA-binding NarL/FixJ family response regulator